jgi:uncharacterized protein Yka (UPF0111/DUF47 family)
LVLPAETEERVKRRALNACQDNLRKVLELTRKTPQMVEHFAKGDKGMARQLFTEIRKGEEEVIIARRMVSQELAEIGAILISREDFLRFTNLTSEIADFSEGVFDSVLKLRETMMVLSYGSAKTLEKAKDVEIAERIVDELYRGLAIKVLSSKLDLPVLFLMRDVLQLLEDSADKAEDAADAARILSFIM